MSAEPLAATLAGSYEAFGIGLQPAESPDNVVFDDPRRYEPDRVVRPREAALGAAGAGAGAAACGAWSSASGAASASP